MSRVVASNVYQATWEFNRPGINETVSVPYALTHEEPRTLLLTGFGERNVGAIASRLQSSDLRLVVANIPYPSQGPLSDEIVTLAACMGVAALRKAVADIMPYGCGGIGISKGGGELLLAASQDPDAWEWLIFGAPLGLTDIKGRELRRRVVRNSNGFQADESEVPSLLRELNAGLRRACEQKDGPMLMRRLQKTGRVALMFGGKDPVFIPAEAQETLGPDNLTIVEGAGHYSVRDERTTEETVEMILKAHEELAVKGIKCMGVK